MSLAVASSKRVVAEGSDAREVRSAGPPKSDEVVFSSRTEEFRWVRAALDALREGISPRVSELRQRVETGTYAMSGEAIAEAMLLDESTAQFLGLGSGR